MWPGNPKITKTNPKKGPSTIAAPPTRRKDNNKNPISHATNQTNNTPSMVQASSDQHTPKKAHQPHKPTKQENNWHTIEFSHNTRTPKHTPQQGLLKAAQPTLHTPTQQTKSQSMRIK